MVSGDGLAEWFKALDLKCGSPLVQILNCYLDLFSVVPS